MLGSTKICGDKETTLEIGDASRSRLGNRMVLGAVAALLLSGTAFAGTTNFQSPSLAPAEQAPTSIWESKGSEITAYGVGADGLQTKKKPAQPPILVPLPATILAAVSGLGIAWIVRRRFIRT